mgnify:CR=1 FL=1|tara:strand:+ start:401 stop:598 length:198 start_codon:yes stop_codon:yes gene_type:complete
MVDVLNEIDFLKDVLITMREGASDEKRMMMNAIENRIKVKEDEVADFEAEVAANMVAMENGVKVI